MRTSNTWYNEGDEDRTGRSIPWRSTDVPGPLTREEGTSEEDKSKNQSAESRLRTRGKQGQELHERDAGEGGSVESRSRRNEQNARCGAGWRTHENTISVTNEFGTPNAEEVAGCYSRTGTGAGPSSLRTSKTQYNKGDEDITWRSVPRRSTDVPRLSP